MEVIIDQHRYNWVDCLLLAHRYTGGRAAVFWLGLLPKISDLVQVSKDQDVPHRSVNS